MKTLAAISTALGPGGIGIVRISGENAIKIVKKFFKTLKSIDWNNIKGYTAKLGKVFDENGVVDQAIALFFLAPNSYTGENIVEISCHGGVYIIKKVLKLALENGAVLAAPGEFTKRAFLNGKINLSEAESVANLISAQSEKASRLAISGLEGNTNKKIQEIKDDLTDIAAGLSVWADYPEEDIPQVEENLLKNNMQKIKDRLLKVLEAQEAVKAVSEGLKIAIIGRPNVGKSSLLNLLMGYQKAIVTDIAGTTRDIVEGNAMIGDIPVKLFDTAGIRVTSDVVEKIGVDRAKNILQDADLVLIMFDGSEKLLPEDREIIKIVDTAKTIAVVNKADLENKIEKNEIEKIFKQVVFISTKKDLGRDKLKKEIYDFVNMQSLNVCDISVYGERQFEIINRAVLLIKEIEDSLSLGITLDAVTVLLQNLIEVLGEITGENVNEEIIDKIFSKFCVGK